MDSNIVTMVEDATIDLRNEIVKKINSNIPPPNAESTLAKKKPKTHTLVDTGVMINSVEWKVTDTGDNIIAEAGIFDENVAEYALANEYGTPTIPARSFLRTSWDESKDRILSDLENNVLDYLEKELIK
jgi:hypothetical protein